jgi:hypothetical protein
MVTSPPGATFQILGKHSRFLERRLGATQGGGREGIGGSASRWRHALILYAAGMVSWHNFCLMPRQAILYGGE